MDVNLDKVGLIEWIAQLQDTSVLEKIKTIYNEHKEDKDWWDGISDDHKESIARGLKDIEDGRVHSHSEAKKLYEKYL